MRVVFTVTCSWYFLRFLNLTIIQTYVCGSTNEWNPFITKPINGIYRLFIVNFSLVGLGAFKLKYLLRRGDGSEACLALPASRCPRHHHERAASHTAWRTDKHLGRKSNYMTVCEKYISHRKINFSWNTYYHTWLLCRHIMIGELERKNLMSRK